MDQMTSSSFWFAFLKKRDIEAWPEESSKEFMAVLEELRVRV
jgi:hypothetical protein